MDESAEILSQYLPEIQRRLEAIDAKLSGQFENADGLTYTLRLTHGLLATIQQKWDASVSSISSVNAAAWISAIAIVAYVAHHW